MRKIVYGISFSLLIFSLFFECFKNDNSIESNTYLLESAWSTNGILMILNKGWKKLDVFANRNFIITVTILCLFSLTSCQKRDLAEREGYIEVTGGKVWYRIVGSGSATPLLLLHGGPGIGSSTLNSLAQLADERPIIFYDQLGCGKSDRPHDTNLWRIERFVDELAQLRQELGIDKVHILGHSWGTMLAVEYMLSQPIGVESIIFASPCLSTAKWIEDAKKLRADLPKGTQEILDRHEKAGTTDSEEYLNATMEFYKRYVCRLDPWPEKVQNALAELNMEVYGTMWGTSEFNATGNLKDYDCTEKLNQITVPVLFTAGRYDESTPETIALYQSMIPDSKVKIFEDASHLTMVEKPEMYALTIKEFLNNVEKRNK